MYGIVPPAAVTVAVPSELPLHEILAVAEIVEVSKFGSVILTELVLVQLLASVTVTT